MRTAASRAGATIDEALSAVRKGKTLPTVPFYSDAQYSIGEASSFVAAGLATMNGDICRLSPYTTGKGDDAQEVFPGEQHAWKFNFDTCQHRYRLMGEVVAEAFSCGQKLVRP